MKQTETYKGAQIEVEPFTAMQYFVTVSGKDSDGRFIHTFIAHADTMDQAMEKGKLFFDNQFESNRVVRAKKVEEGV